PAAEGTGRVGDVAAGQPAGRHLIQQRLEGRVNVAVDQRGPHSGAGQPAHRRRPPNPAPATTTRALPPSAGISRRPAAVMSTPPPVRWAVPSLPVPSGIGCERARRGAGAGAWGSRCLGESALGGAGAGARAAWCRPSRARGSLA